VRLILQYLVLNLDDIHNMRCRGVLAAGPPHRHLDHLPNKMEIKTRSLSFLLLLLPGLCDADGRGLIGYGRNMYYPLCAAVCRGTIEKAPLQCTPHNAATGGGHNHGKTPPGCFATDLPYMQTLAFCINVRCKGEYTADILESYWRQHVVGGGRIVLEPKPAMSYAQALASIKTPPTEEYIPGEMLNKTSLISDQRFLSYENAWSLFEAVETGHSKYRCAPPELC
jgi:hypothetical protein